MPDPADSINLRAVLACGFCGQNLQVQGDGSAQCAGCGQRYARTAAGTLDLRLQRSKARELCFELGTPLAVDPSLRIEPLVASSAPQVDFRGIAVPQHVTPEFMSYFPKAREPGSLMLDLGCGQACPVHVLHGFGHVGNQLRQLRPEFRHGIGNCAQHRIPDDADIQNGHVQSVLTVSG